MKNIYYILGILILVAFGYLGYQKYSKSVVYDAGAHLNETPASTTPGVAAESVASYSTTTKYYDFSYQVPGENQIASKIIKDNADKWLAETNIVSVTNDKQAENDFGIFSDMKYEYDSKYEKKENAEYVTYLETIFAFTGGAHPSTAIVSHTFDKKDQSKQVGMGDIYNDKVYGALSDYTRKTMPALFNKKGIIVSEIKDMFDDGTSINKNNWQTFYFKNDVLVVVFNQYQIGPYAIGIHEINIPLSLLAQYKK